MRLKIVISFELGLKVSGKRPAGTDRGNLARHSGDNAFHLRRRKNRIAGENRKDKFVAQSDNQAAGTSLVGVFERFTLLAFFNNNVSVLLENRDRIGLCVTISRLFISSTFFILAFSPFSAIMNVFSNNVKLFFLSC